MNWSGERYVRVYCRNTWKLHAVGWEGRATLWELLRHCDLCGVFDAREPEAVASMIGMPTEVVARGLEALLREGVVRVAGTRHLIIVNYVEAQYAAANNSQRKRKERSRRRALARAKTLQSVSTQNVTIVANRVSDDAERDFMSREVTAAGNTIQSIGASQAQGRFESSSDSPLSAGPIAPQAQKSEAKNISSGAPAPGQILEAATTEGRDREQEKRERDRAKRAEKRAEAEAVAGEFVAHLNRVTGRRFQRTKSVVDRVARHLREGRKREDFARVVDAQWRKWRGTAFEQYMRPSTLLGYEKFAEYLAAADDTPGEKSKRSRDEIKRDLLRGIGLA